MKPLNSLRSVVLIAIAFFSSVPLLHAEDAQPGTDVLTFVNGDHLTGTLVSEADGSVVFHSDMSGDVKVGWEKIQSLRTGGSYAVIRSGEVLRVGRPAPQIPIGPITVSPDTITVASSSGEKSVPVKETGYLVPADQFASAIAREPGLLHGWAGPVTLGASLVESTQTSETFTGAIALVRAVPSVDWLRLRDKTLFGATAAYGLTREPLIAGVQSASSAKTNILHGELERDQYVTSRLYYLFDASADHNVGSGLQIQQDYGAGAGATLIKTKVRLFDVKGDIHYEKQDFYPSAKYPRGRTLNLVGATIGESLQQKLPRSLVFTESGLIQPAFNTPANSASAWSAQVLAALLFPVYKNLGFSLGSQDNFINNPPAGYKKNTFQFTAGVTYSLK